MSQQFKDALSNFNEIVLSYEVKSRKPDKEFYNECLKKAKCKAQECLYIDDKEEFVHAAQEKGMVGIHYTNFNKFLDGLQLCVNIQIKIFGEGKEYLIKIYEEKYLNFRHFDTLRWQIFGLFFTLTGVILGIGPRQAGSQNPEPWILLLLGIFTLLIALLITRINKAMRRNTNTLRQVASKIGDYSIPMPPGWQGAMFWINWAIWLLGIGLTVIGASLCLLNYAKL